VTPPNRDLQPDPLPPADRPGSGAAAPRRVVATHRFTPPGGPALAVHAWGGDGPPVLLAHPTGFHGVVWAPVASALVDAGRHVWSFDFRGHGDSDPAPGGDYDWAGFGADVGAVVDHLDLAGQPGLLGVGHSKGGAALLQAEADRPGTFERLYCFEPIVFPTDDPPPPDPANPMSAAARRRRAVWPDRDAAFESYSSRPPLSVLDPEALRAYVDHGLRDRPDGTVELKCTPEHEARVYETGGRNGMYSRLGAIRCPVVVACGAPTDAINEAVAGMLAARLPRGRVEVFEGLGHFGPLQDPERFATAVLRFADAPDDPAHDPGGPA